MAIAPGLAHGSAPIGFHGAHLGMGHGHVPPSGWNGWRHKEWNGWNRSPWNGRNRSAWNRWNHNGGNWSQLGLAGWGGSWDYSGGQLQAPSAPIIIGGGPPVAINLYAGAGGGESAGGYMGACVIHKLEYNNAGKFVGERQIPAC